MQIFVQVPEVMKENMKINHPQVNIVFKQAILSDYQRAQESLVRRPQRSEHARRKDQKETERQRCSASVCKKREKTIQLEHIVSIELKV